MAIQWQDNDLGSGEYLDVYISPTAGTTTGSMTDHPWHNPAGNGDLVTHQILIGSYNGTNITVGFADKTNDNWGLVLTNVQTVILPSLDLGVTSLNISPFVQTGSSTPITGTIHNYGATSITSMNLNYTVNGGAPVVSAVSPSGFALGTDYVYNSSTPWVPATAGSYTIKVWADNLNGSGADENNANDTFTATVNVIDSLQPKTVMIEEFTQASCDPCAGAAPNVDSVYANNTANALLVRYHVNFPGQDFMNQVTQTPFVGAMVSFYNVTGVPDAQLDGQYIYPGAGSLTTPAIQALASQGSPFKITVTPYFSSATQTYSFSATIKCFGNLPAGLKARAVLAIDQLTYTNNQSTESIAQYNFPEVAETMFGSGANGTALAAFTPGTTQTFSSTWVKNHAWAKVTSATWNYDSTATGKIIVWVENDATKTVYQAASAVVAVSALGVNAVSLDKGSMDVYPNPASNTATVALKLNTTADVSLEVYNMAGQVVYSMPSESRSVGTSVSSINLANLASGDYFVRVSVGTETLTKKLTVAK